MGVYDRSPHTGATVPRQAQIPVNVTDPRSQKCRSSSFRLFVFVAFSLNQTRDTFRSLQSALLMLLRWRDGGVDVEKCRPRR